MSVGYVLIAIALLFANGFFVGAEFSLMTARQTRLEELGQGGNLRARLAIAAIRDLNFMLAGTQLGITAASLGLGYVGEPAVGRAVEHLIGTSMPEEAAHSVALATALFVVVFFHMVVGEMVPKNIAIAKPEDSALWLAPPMRVIGNVLRPFIRLLNAVANGMLRAIGIEPRDEIAASHTAHEIGVMVAQSAREGVLEEFEQRLLSGAVGLGERDAGAAMVPRTEMHALPLSSTPAEIERVVVETGLSRFPIYGRDLDQILGFVHAKDLLKVPAPDRDRPLSQSLIREMLVIPESRRLPALLVDMRRRRRHFALVLDEHGGTAGIVSMEDVLEELVGEIRDEHDIGGLGVERLSADRWLVPGSLRIDEAADHLGVRLPEGEYETVAGFLMDRLGRIPKRRDAITEDGWRLRVRSMHRRRVVQVLIERTPAEDDRPEADPDAQ